MLTKNNVALSLLLFIPKVILFLLGILFLLLALILSAAFIARGLVSFFFSFLSFAFLVVFALMLFQQDYEHVVGMAGASIVCGFLTIISRSLPELTQVISNFFFSLSWRI